VLVSLIPSDSIFLEPTGAIMDDLPVFRYGPRDAEFYGIEGELHVTLWEKSGYSLGSRVAPVDIDSFPTSA
jgi:hypothetical protein